MNAETPVRGLPGLERRQTPVVRRQGTWRSGLRAAYASMTGSSHARNEDCCSHVPSSDRPAFVGVADGVGGGAHGEIASSVLLDHCAQAPKAVYCDPARLVEWIGRADAEVRNAISRRTEQAGAATLAAAWFPSQSVAHVLNVGDCRVYQLTPHNDTYTMRQLTIDQTYATLGQEPPSNGNPGDPARMVGAGAVGVPPVVKAHLRQGDLLLLCSDGVHKFVSDEQMSALVSNGLAKRASLETICGSLTAAAKANGSQDDASALLVMRRPWFRGLSRWMVGGAVIAVLLLSLFAGAHVAFAETQSVIDPTETPQPPPAASKQNKPEKAPKAEPSRSMDTTPDKAERRRAAAEERRRARASALAAEKAQREATAREAAARQAAAREAAARESARRAAARAAERAAARAAATRAAAAKATNARIAAEREAVEREEAARQAAVREAERELVAREIAAREAAAKEAAIKEANAKQAVEREAAARAAGQAAASQSKLVTAGRTRRGGSPPQFGTVFRDCAECPELVWLPPGESIMGDSPDPRATATIDYMLAVGRFEVTFGEWDACVAAGGCRRNRDSGWGRGRQPVIDVSWDDAQAYAAWISRRTGKHYRLLTEAEWEYAARAGTDARYWWGDEARAGAANCNDCGTRWDGRRPSPVGSFAPNPFGLHDMHGNVWEWVADCSHACISQDSHIIRGGAWQAPARAMRSAARAAVTPGFHDNRIGFRIARTE